MSRLSIDEETVVDLDGSRQDINARLRRLMAPPPASRWRRFCAWLGTTGLVTRLRLVIRPTWEGI